MQKRTLSLLLSIILLFTLITPTFAAAQGVSNQKQISNDTTAVGSYIIKFKDAEKGKMTLGKRNKKVEKAFKHLSSHVTTNLSTTELEDLKNDSNVAYIEKDSIVKKTGDIITQNLNQIHVPEVQSQGVDGTGVKVAVLDTGINTQSPELHVAGGASFVPNDSSLNDKNGHGTFVAGILTALKDNQGLVGVAPNVSLYDVKVLDGSGNGSYSQVIQGIDWAIENHMDVVSMSFAGSDYSAALEEATQLANSNGILLVAATGNDGASTVSYPAKLPSVMAVGAVDSNNQLAPFSNTGTEVDIVAPGVDIKGLSLSGGNYITMNGTSMAVPQVAGVAALIKQKNATLNNQDIRHVLENSATSLGDGTKYGHGLIHAANAVNLAAQTISQGAASSQSGTIVTGSVYNDVYRVTSAGILDSSALVNVNIKTNDAPFSLGNQEQISSMSGGLSLQVPELTLPGRNGLSFSLTRIYDSSDAQYYGMSYQAAMSNGADLPYGTIIWYNTTYTGLYSNKHITPYSQTLYPIGTGWTWNIPSIETKNYGDGNGNQSYLHMPGQGTYHIVNNQLAGYPWSDLTLSSDNSVTVNGISSTLKLHSLAGRDYYFAGNGSLIQLSDAYGNAIKFAYRYDGMLQQISDDIQNAITITYPSSAEVDLQLGNRKIVYTKTVYGDGTAVLTKVTDANNHDTTYGYTYGDSQFKLVDWSSVSDPYALLTSVTYPTQAKSIYEYENAPVYKKIGSNNTFVQYYRTKSRHDEMTVNAVLTSVNRKNFTYIGGVDSSYGTDNSFSTQISDDLKTTTYSFWEHFMGNGTPSVYRLQTVDDQVSDTFQGQPRITDRISNYGFTQSQTYTAPNTTTVQYKQQVSGTTSYSTAITSNKNYNNFGNVTDETSPLGIKNIYTYDPNTQWLSNVSEPLDSVRTKYTTYTRNTKGTITDISVTETNTSGVQREHQSFIPDSYGNITTKTIYDDNGKQYVISDIYNSATPYNGGFLTQRAVTVTDVDGTQTQIKQTADYYTDSGKAKSYTDANGFTTSFVYDNLDRIKTETFQDGSSKQWKYDDVNNWVTYTDETGVVSTTKWNQLGWKTLEGISGAGVTSYGYDAYGRQTTISDAAVPAHISTLTYDNWGRETNHQYPDGFSSSTQYDDIAHTKTSVDGESNQVRETYDKLGRLTLKELQKKDAAKFVPLTNYTYDNVGNILTATDANNYTTTSTYDILGRLKSVTEPSPLSNTTQYTYSLAGNLTQIQYAVGNVLKKQYDELGRLIQKTDPAGQVDKYYYDVVNHTTKHIDHNGVTTQQINDNRNRLWKSITPQETIIYTYDAAGRRKTMQDGTGNASYDYFPTTGQLKSVTFPDQKTMTYTYDGTIGNVQTVTDPFGAVSAYGYDAENRLAGVGPALGNWDESYASANSYNKDNLLVSTVQRNGVTTTYGYDWVRANSVTQTKSGGANINNFGYGYDLNNNVTSKAENGASYSYTYDQDNRISTSTQFNEQYTYDARGNRQTLQTNNQPSFNGASYTYDDRNRLTSVTLDNGSSVTYQYNGDGLLYQRTENGQTTRYYYNGTQLIAEGIVSNGTVTQKASYIRGHGLVARVDASGNKAYYLKNGHGDVVGLTDSAGNTLNSYSYDMWGNPLTTSEQVQQPFRYSSEFYDNTTGLQYLKARWYDPSVGRFINQDSYEGDLNNPLSLNLYTYANNNPLLYNDPSGHFAFLIPLVIAAAEFLASDAAIMATTAVGSSLIAMNVDSYMNIGQGIMNGDPGAWGELGLNIGMTAAFGVAGAAFESTATKSAVSEMGMLERPVAGDNIGINLRSNSGLLPGEGNVGTYGDLIDAGIRGDNITPHHMPSANYMSQFDVSKYDGVSMNMEQPYPGVGGRHRLTQTYGLNGSGLEDYLSLSPRDALARDIWDARSIYMQDGLYGDYIRGSLQDTIGLNKELYPELFSK